MSEAKDYINALQKFSDSVLHLVEAIKSQTTEKKSFENIVGSSKEQSKLLLENAKKLTVIVENTEETKTDTKEILKLVKKLKQEKEKGIWETMSKKDKAKNVKESVKTITLMAGGILAIGAAFKLVGEVDFKSVMALSLALPAVAYAFNKVGENTSSPKENSQIALSMIIMSGGVLGSAHLLAMAPTISLGSLFTAIGVSAALAIAMYGVSTTLQNTDDNDIKRMYMIAPVMPILAGGIMASGLLLQNMPSIGLTQVLSTIGVGIALGSSMIPLAIASRMVGGKSKEMVTLSLLLPLTSAGLVASGMLLQNMPALDTINILKGALSISASTVALAGTVWVMDKMGLASPGGMKTVLFGMLGATLMSGGLMVMSHILNQGNYGNYPSTDWAAGVGLSMLGYLPAVLITGTIAMSGIGALALLAGVAAMTGIAGGLVGVSHILSNGNYKGGPTEEWARGASLAIMGFVDPILKLSPGLFGMLLGDTLESKIKSIEKIGTGLKNASMNIAGGNYSGGPSPDWALGVGLSLMSFAATMETVEPGLFDKLLFGTSLDDKLASMIKVASTLPAIGEAVGKDTSMYSGGPKKEWAEGSANSILAFATALDTIDTGWFESNLDAQLWGMIKVARILPELGKAVGNDTSMYGGGPEKDWAEAISITLGAFAESLDTVDDGWFGSNLKERLEGMLSIARILPRLGWAVTNKTDMYQGGPTKEWAQNIGQSLNIFSDSVGKMVDNATPEEYTKMYWPLIYMGHVIKRYSEMFNGLSFSNFPSEKWSNGTAAFINSFTSIKGINNTKSASKEIYRLSWAYNKLADSLSGVGDVMKNMPNEIPDVSGLYSGLVTLSLIDDSNLKTVLESMKDHEGNLENTMSAIISASNKTKTDMSSGFSGLFDFAKVTSAKASSQTPQASNPLLNQGKPASVNTTITKKEEDKEVKIDTKSLEDKLSEMSGLLTSMTEVLNDIADNTASEKDISKLLD